MLIKTQERIMSEWQQRNITEEPRLSELVEMYEDLDFDVKVETFSPDDFPGECSDCMKEDPGRYRVIYTKKKSE